MMLEAFLLALFRVTLSLLLIPPAVRPIRRSTDPPPVPQSNESVAVGQGYFSPSVA